MTVLETMIDPRRPSYLQNRGAMLERLAELEAALDAARAGGGEKSVTRHHARGKLLPRERVELLLDRDAPFLELAAVAAWGSEFTVGASVVTGIGVVEGAECMIIASDSTVEAGAANPYTINKIRRAVRIAAENRLPLVALVESAGDIRPARVPDGGLARDLADLTARGIPTVSVVFGPTSGETAYLPALSDYTIMVRGHAKVLTIGPQSRPGSPGRSAPEVRSGPLVPVTAPGYADHLAEDERDGLRLARQCVRRLNWRKQGPGPHTSRPVAPRYDAEELLAVAGAAASRFEPREVLARLLDGSEFTEFRPAYGPGLLAGWGELHGYPVGVLAGADPAGPAEIQKAVHLAQVAAVAATPLLLVQHGGTADADAEAAGPAAALVQALAAARVGHLCLTVGGPAGTGWRVPEPRFAFSWPGGCPEATHPGELADDAVIDPRDTRTVLGLCLSAMQSAAVQSAAHRGIARSMTTMIPERVGS